MEYYLGAAGLSSNGWEKTGVARQHRTANRQDRIQEEMQTAFDMSFSLLNKPLIFNGICKFY